MAAKKPNPLPDSIETLHLTGDLFWHWKLHDAALRHAEREKQLLEALITEEINKNPRLVAFLGEKANALSTISMAVTKLQEVIVQAERELGVSLTNCQIDDVTGEIHTVTHDGGHVPFKK